MGCTWMREARDSGSMGLASSKVYSTSAVGFSTIFATLHSYGLIYEEMINIFPLAQTLKGVQHLHCRQPHRLRHLALPQGVKFKLTQLNLKLMCDAAQLLSFRSQHCYVAAQFTHHCCSHGQQCTPLQQLHARQHILSRVFPFEPSSQPGSGRDAPCR